MGGNAQVRERELRTGWALELELILNPSPVLASWCFISLSLPLFVFKNGDCNNSVYLIELLGELNIQLCVIPRTEPGTQWTSINESFLCI